jgi:hypothetical protein
VDDIEAPVAYLEGHGLKVSGAPEYKTNSPYSDEAWVYFVSPWGMQLELVS